MNAENAWKIIMNKLQETPTEISTVPSDKKEPLWFKASIDKGILYVHSAANHIPSAKISKRRKISQKGFEAGLSL